MKKCTHPQDSLIEQYLLDCMSREEESDFRDHLLQCDVCSAKLEAVRRLATELYPEPEATVVVSTSERPLWPKIVIPAACVLLIGVLGLVFLWRPSGGIPEVPGTVHSDTLPAVDSLLRDNLRPSVERQMPRDNVAREGTITDIEKQPTFRDKKIEEIIQQHTGMDTPAPGYASNDSTGLETSQGMDRAGAAFRLITPTARETLEVKGKDPVEMVFRWEAPAAEPVVLVFFRGDEILAQYVEKEKESIKADLSEFIEYAEIEWVIMYKNAETRVRGEIFFK